MVKAFKNASYSYTLVSKVLDCEQKRSKKGGKFALINFLHRQTSLFLIITEIFLIELGD